MHAFLFSPVSRALAYLRWPKGNLLLSTTTLSGDTQKVGARFFSEVHGDGARGNRHKLEHKKFQLDIRIFFLP